MCNSRLAWETRLANRSRETVPNGVREGAMSHHGWKRERIIVTRAFTRRPGSSTPNPIGSGLKRTNSPWVSLSSSGAPFKVRANSHREKP